MQALLESGLAWEDAAEGTLRWRKEELIGLTLDAAQPISPLNAEPVKSLPPTLL